MSSHNHHFLGLWKQVDVYIQAVKTLQYKLKREIKVSLQRLASLFDVFTSKTLLYIRLCVSLACCFSGLGFYCPCAREHIVFRMRRLHDCGRTWCVRQVVEASSGYFIFLCICFTSYLQFGANLVLPFSRPVLFLLSVSCLSRSWDSPGLCVLLLLSLPGCTSRQGPS